MEDDPRVHLEELSPVQLFNLCIGCPIENPDGTITYMDNGAIRMCNSMVEYPKRLTPRHLRGLVIRRYGTHIPVCS